MADAIERIVYAVTDQDQVRRHPILVFMGVRVPMSVFVVAVRVPPQAPTSRG